MQGEVEVPSRLQPGVVIAEKYRLVRLLGRGGMGEVFEAEETGGRRVALKSFFRLEGGTEATAERARFLREAGVTRGLESDHLIRVFDHGYDPTTGTPFIVLELLDGEDLESAVGRVGPLDPSVAGAIVAQACRGLDVAHRAGIVHRDIKPANLFLQRMPGGEIVTKVCDFGVAKVHTAESLTVTGSVLGSPLYMAPEQLASAKHVDGRVDVWSLGMTLYFALTGVAALDHVSSFAELVVAISRGEFKNVQDAAPWVPADLARVLHGTLMVDAKARCPSMHEMFMALSAALPGGTRVSAGALAPLSPQTRGTVASKMGPIGKWQPPAPPATSAFDATQMEEEDPLLGTTLAGKYSLLRVLGRGGMGAVYEARTPDGKGYALKVIRPDLGDSKGREAVKRFVREAKASQGIDSPYVAQIVDAGADEERGVPYITMELLKGDDLGRAIKDNGPLDPGVVVAVFVQACEGLAAAHARGIVHRDIKPANIFLHEQADGTVVAKICDFGVAKQIAQTDEGTELTRTGGILGSPMYMSPEQATNAKSVDHRSDIWSLGISLYEALTGQKAWEGTSMGELILAICTREVQPVLELAPWIQPELAEVVRKALARKPDDRFESAGDFANALRPFATATQVKREAFRSASDERRKIAEAARSSSSLASRSGLGGSSSVAGQSATVQKPKGRGAMLGAAVALVAIAGVGLVAMRKPDKPPVQPDLVAAAPVAPKTVQAHVAIAPPDANVTANGVVVVVTGGDAVLEGTPGDSIAVVVESDAGRVEAHVVITSDGKAVPARVEIPAPVPAAAASAKGAAHAKPAAPRGAPSAVSSAPSLKRNW